MMEDSDNTQDNQPITHEEINLNDEIDTKSLSQHSDDSSMSGKIINAATTAGKTIVDISVTAAKVTEDTLQKVADEMLHSDHSGEGNGSTPSSPIKDENNEEKTDEQEPVTSKVIHAATSAGKTVVDLSVSAAKKTGDVLHKVVESASEVIHKHKSSGEGKENSSPEGAATMEGATEGEQQEPVTAKVLHAASAAGKTVVDLSVSAANTIGEVINKVASSAGEALHKEKPAAASAEGEAEPSQEESEGEVTPAPVQAPTEGSQGSRMWTSVRRMSEKVINTTSSTISKAAASVQHHGEAKPESDANDPEQVESERSRSGSLTQLWSSVRKTADTIVDSASAAYKAAEPVAISTATKVSHGAQTVWTTTKEKVFPVKKEDSEETETQKETTETEIKEEEATDLINPEAAKSDPVDIEQEEEEEEKPRLIATSAEPEIISSTNHSTFNEPSNEDEPGSDIQNAEESS